MDKSLKNGMLLIAFAMLLLTVSINIDSVINLISSFFSLLMPIIFGLIFAFILSVPMKFFENFLSKHLHKQVSKKLSYLAFLLTLLSVILVIVVVAVIVVPQLSRSIIELSRLIQNQLPGLLDTLESYNIDVSSIEKWVKDFDYKTKNGESLNEVIKRELEALKYILNNYKEFNCSKVLVVGHSTALASLFSVWCNITQEGYFFKDKLFFDGKWNYCETFKLIFDDNDELISIENI